MRILPPSDQDEQRNIYEFEDWIPERLTELIRDGEDILTPTNDPGQLPSTSYRARYNERTDSWTCDWFNEDGAVIDQGRRLSINNLLRTPWGDAFAPSPMPAFIALMDSGGTDAEATWETFGRSAKLVELNIQDAEDAGIFLKPPSGVTIEIVS